MAGSHASQRKGASPEFSEYRAFRPGDDTRRLDWKLLARTDRAFMRLTNDHAALATTIIVDASASMAFPEASLAKWRRACDIGIGLASVAHSAGDPVALTVGCNGALRSVGATSRRDVVMRHIELLDSIVPGGTAPLAEAVAQGAFAQRVVVLSDFLDDDPAVDRAVRGLTAMGISCVGVEILAVEELDPPSEARLAVDPESGELHGVLDRASRTTYDRAFGQWRAELAQRWQDAGAELVAVSTLMTAIESVRGVVQPRGHLLATSPRS